MSTNNLFNGSLLPVKGIDETRRSFLGELGINSPSELLELGRTVVQRKSIAQRMMRMEITDFADGSDVYKWERRFEKYVDSWVKQVDLWRVEGMDADTAYFLVELGVRHVEDLQKVDPVKAYAVMNCLKNTQADYTLVSLDRLKALINNSKKLSNKHSKYQKTLNEMLSSAITKVPGRRTELKDLERLLSKIRIEDIIGGSLIEIDDPSPEFLFADKEEETIKADVTDSMKIITKGLGFLQEIEATLPLPKSVRGTVYITKQGERLPEDKKSRKDFAFDDVLVEISGISSPNEDKSEDAHNPQGYTDSNGDFIIVLPDNYNMQESLTFTVSKGSYKQKFTVSANDIIEHVEKQKVLAAFNELDLLVEDLQTEEEKLNFICMMEYLKGISDDSEAENKYANCPEPSADDEVRYAELASKKDEIIKEIEIIKEMKSEKEDFIRLSDTSTNNLEKILRNLMYSTNLVSDFRNEPFVVNEDAFYGYKKDQKRVLPSVKLMENDGEAIYLPTDTAPSRIFNYSMLQRLVEPAIYPLADKNNSLARKPVSGSIDVMNFKNKISTKPDEWPQMASLGIGYVLNMHQAWVPDGFALGTLLYSLILAPGEEQRLIVREKKQSYSLMDVAEGSESVDESYETSQNDNTTAAYQYALNQLSEGKSDYSYSTKASSFGASGGAAGVGSGFGAMIGLSGSTSKTSGKGSASASQSNSHSEASNAAQNFQHGIKTASEKISQAQRLSISMATGEETDSVATRIIANHNHSHAMTIQYWEVMRRYKLETCVDGVDLVLFVPLKLINFLNGDEYILSSSEMTMAKFKSRYNVILNYADALEGSLPYKYRSGLNLIRRYAAYPSWKMENLILSQRQAIFSFKGIFLPFDDITAVMILKNGKGTIAASMSYDRDAYPFDKDFYETTDQLTEEIKRRRNNYSSKYANKECICTFMLPSNVTNDDIQSIRIDYRCDDFKYVLYKNPEAEGMNNSNAESTYEKMLGKMWDLAKDRKDSANDRTKIAYYKSMLPEAWIEPNITLSSAKLKSLGVPVISDINLSITGESGSLNTMASGSILNSSIYVSVSSVQPTLRFSEFQQIEETVHHIVSNTMKYSQAIWGSLTADERALMLEQYTIDMDYSEISGKSSDEDDSGQSLSLLNCINVKNLLGFYGNCMLFPFTYPQKLADKIGKTAAELQESLYKYHTNYFRVPSTTISLPTDGMIGEAVLGETNVSEEIDLTRFWNWKDSPIDSMNLDSSYLDNTDYLSGKTTKDISALNLQGASATTPVTAADLVSALIGKQTPTFSDITGLNQLKDVLNTATDSAAKGRDAALATSADMAKSSMEYAYKSAELESKNKNNNNNSENENQNDSGNQNNSGGENQNGSGQNGDGQNGSGQNGDGQNGGGQNGGGHNGDGQNGGGQNGDGQNGGGQNGDGKNGGGQTDGDGKNDGGKPDDSGKPDGSVIDCDDGDSHGEVQTDGEGGYCDGGKIPEVPVEINETGIELDLDLLKSIINGLISYNSSGKSPEDYLYSVTGNKLSESDMKSIAEKLCSELGISFSGNNQ